MAIDNKFHAVETLIANDERPEAVDLVQLLVKGIGKLPFDTEAPGVQLVLDKRGQRREQRQKEHQVLMPQPLISTMGLGNGASANAETALELCPRGEYVRLRAIPQRIINSSYLTKLVTN